MITKKLIIIFLLIIAIIIILIIKNKSKKVEIEQFILDLNIEEENDYNNVISRYYYNNIDYVPIINRFGILETNNIDIQKDLILPNKNISFNNLNNNELNTNTLNTKNATINNINSTDNIVNTTNNYNKFTKLNTENINTNTITNSIDANIKNISILNNLNISNTNFENSTMYVDRLCFDNKCFDKSLFDDINKIDIIKQKYNSPLNQYMYLPNSRNTDGTIINNNNVIWKDIKNEITPNNNSDGKLKSINSTWIMDYNSYNWNGKCIYRTNTGTSIQNNGIGIEIIVPEHPNKSKGEDYTVLWVQTLGERWSTFRVYQFDTTTNRVVKHFHKHASGLNNLNKISPDGSTHSELWNAFEWTPVPIDLTGNNFRKIMISNYYSTDTWFSGFAFSTNPWNHYKCHALEIHWQIHKINPSLTTDTIVDIDNNNSYIRFDREDNQPIGIFVNGASAIFRIPFINNNKDKIFYIVETNRNYVTSVPKISIFKGASEVNLGNLYTTFDNPFSRHHNSKLYQRYLGVKIPKEHLPVVTQTYAQNNYFITLRLFTNSVGIDLKFSEVGTHDENPF